MLSGARLGQEIWAEAVETTCYLVNKSPSSMLKDKTPQEVWIGKKPFLSHLRVFRCDAYVHVPKEKRTKLDSKSKKCIFIGPTKEPEKREFKLKEEESDSIAEEESKDEEPQTLGVRRSVQEKKQPERYSPYPFCLNFALYIIDDDPRNVKEIVDLEDGKLWKEAMVDEMASLHKNEAWDLVELSVGMKPIGRKWVFKKKTNAEGKVEKYKARLVAKGYSQVPGIDFGDIFPPISKVTSIRLLLSVPATFDFEIEQMDVKIVSSRGSRRGNLHEAT
eukprot:PITA_16539